MLLATQRQVGDVIFLDILRSEAGDQHDQLIEVFKLLFDLGRRRLVFNLSSIQPVSFQQPLKGFELKELTTCFYLLRHVRESKVVCGAPERVRWQLDQRCTPDEQPEYAETEQQALARFRPEAP